MLPLTTNNDELAFDEGLTAKPRNYPERIAPMADLFGSIIDDVHSGDISAVEALDLHNHACLILADLFGTIHDECVPTDVETFADRFEREMNS